MQQDLTKYPTVVTIVLSCTQRHYSGVGIPGYPFQCTIQAQAIPPPSWGSAPPRLLQVANRVCNGRSHLWLYYNCKYIIFIYWNYWITVKNGVLFTPYLEIRAHHYVEIFVSIFPGPSRSVVTQFVLRWNRRRRQSKLNSHSLTAVRNSSIQLGKDAQVHLSQQLFFFQHQKYRSNLLCLHLPGIHLSTADSGSQFTILTC